MVILGKARISVTHSPGDRKKTYQRQQKTAILLGLCFVVVFVVVAVVPGFVDVDRDDEMRRR